jgi:hypothetical protein
VVDVLDARLTRAHIPAAAAAAKAAKAAAAAKAAKAAVRPKKGMPHCMNLLVI